MNQRNEIKGLHKDGTEFPATAAISKIATPSGLTYTVILDDITDQRNRELILQRQSIVFEQMSEAVFILDISAGLVIDVNKSAETLTGYSREELIGTNLDYLVPPLTDLEKWRGEWRVNRDREFEERGVFTTSQEIVRKDGQICQTEVSVAPLRDDKGKMFFHITVIRDVTEQKDLETKLVQAQKMETVGQLTGGIAHDFNNILGVISSSAQLLMMEPGQNPETQETLDRIQRSVGRGASLSDQLLSFSRKQPLRPTLIDLNDLFDKTGEILDRYLGDGVEVRTDVPGDAWCVNADQNQLDNAILNLAINARDAMADVGHLSITVQNIQVNGNTGSPQIPDLKPGPYVKIEVADTGSGMTPDVLEKVFEPFFTTKEVGQGSGMGLSMVYGFAKQSGGTVTIESKVDVGTAVTLYLPAVTDEVDPAVAVTNAPIKLDGGDRKQTVLVVEDEPDLRKINTEIISRIGYSVIAAGTAREALNMIKDMPSLDAAFLDMSLPGGMNGIDLAKELRSLHPELKILFTSGYVPDQNISDLATIDHDGLFRKPVPFADLTERLKEVLSRDGSLNQTVH